MAKNARYNLPYRRRREGKTDYKSRIALIRSGSPRFVVRPSNEHIMVQVVEAQVEGDKVIASVHSKELTSKYDWKGSCSNIPAAYLSGYLTGLKASKLDVKKAVLDIGLKRSTKGAKIFAALKGGVDAGLDIPYSDTISPNEERIRGEHIVNYAKLLSQTPELYQKMFTRYLHKKLKPEDISTHFDEIKSKIDSQFK
jgi:large subunit ribosomal protein L18